MLRCYAKVLVGILVRRRVVLNPVSTGIAERRYRERVTVLNLCLLRHCQPRPRQLRVLFDLFDEHAAALVSRRRDRERARAAEWVQQQVAGL